MLENTSLVWTAKGSKDQPPSKVTPWGSWGSFGGHGHLLIHWALEPTSALTSE